MLNIKNIKINKLTHSNYVLPFEMHYTQDGIEKKWDLIKTHSSVVIIIFNISRNVLVCVKQFRPGVYLNSIPKQEHNEEIDIKKYPPKIGVTLEFCAGIVDKDKSLEEIACDEVYEECGYKILVNNLKKVQSFRSGVGVAGDVMNLFYTEVTDDMKIGSGGGLVEEGENIEVVELSLEESTNILKSENTTAPGEFLYGLLWFMTNVKKLLT